MLTKQVAILFSPHVDQIIYCGILSSWQRQCHVSIDLVQNKLAQLNETSSVQKPCHMIIMVDFLCRCFCWFLLCCGHFWQWPGRYDQVDGNLQKCVWYANLRVGGASYANLRITLKSALVWVWLVIDRKSSSYSSHNWVGTSRPVWTFHRTSIVTQTFIRCYRWSDETKFKFLFL